MLSLRQNNSCIRAICFLGLMICLLWISGCSSEDVMESIRNNYYSSEVYSVDFRTDNYYIYRQGVNVVVILCTYDGENTDYYRYTIDQAGEMSDIILLDVDNAGSFCGVGDNNTVCYLTNGELVIMDERGTIIHRIDTNRSYDDVICDIESSSTGFVTISDSSAVLYSCDGERMSTINLNGIGHPSEETSYFEREEKRYLSVETAAAKTAFYSLDFEEGSYSFVGDNTTYGYTDDYSLYRYGGYSFDEFSGTLSKIDFDNNELVPLAIVNNFIFQPPVYVISTNIHFHIIDDNTYAYVYRYDVDKTDVVLLTPNTNCDYSNRIKLSIKGSNIKEDISLMWSVYKFNTTQNEYLLTASDYGEQYSYSTAIEAQDAKLKLISDFQNGNSPDIFYGKDFDYDQLGANGVVMDIYPYLTNGAINNLTSNLKMLMIKDNRCYSVFSGYTLFGFIGRSTQYTDQDYCIERLPPLEMNQRRICKMYSVDIADFILRYHILKLNGDNYDLDIDNIHNAVQFSIDNGIGPLEYADERDGFDLGNDSMSLRVINNDIKNYLIESRKINDNFTYLGFPSVNDSSKAIYPFGYVAVSSGTDYPEACVEFIKVLLSEESQRLNYSFGTIPVNESVLEEYLNYMVYPDSIPDDMITYKHLPIVVEGFIDSDGHLHRERTNISVSMEEAQLFKEMITSVDTVITYDWGIYNIISEEINSYYLLGRSIDEISSSLYSRLWLYYEENYG